MELSNMTECKMLSVCFKLVQGKYPRDDTVIEKMVSRLNGNNVNFEMLFGCSEFLEFVEQIHLLEKSDKHQAVSAVIRILGLLWKHQPQELDNFKDKVTTVLISFLVRDAKALPKTVLHACLCCLASVFSNGIEGKTNLVKECLPFVKNCLKEESVFVRNAAMSLITDLRVVLLNRKPAKLSPEAATNGISKSVTEVNIVYQDSNSSHDVDQLISESFEIFMSCSKMQYTSVGLGLMLRLCEYLDEKEVYAYLMENLQVPELVVKQMSDFTYPDMVTSLDVLFAIYKNRPDSLKSSLIQTMLSMCDKLLSEGKSLEAALLATWIIENCKTHEVEAGSILFATMQSCLNPDDSRVYVNKSVKTLTRCLASLQYMKCQVPEVVKLVCGVLNPDLGTVHVTSVTQTLKVQCAAIDALASICSCADLHNIKSIIHTCVHILRTSELNYQKISKSLLCIRKAISELGRIHQTSKQSDNEALSDEDIGNLLLSIFDEPSLPNNTQLLKDPTNGNVQADCRTPVDYYQEEGSGMPYKRDASSSSSVNVVALCLRSVKWEVRDSALEFVGGLANLTKACPGLCIWLGSCEFVTLLWYCVEDTESYVRASAITALQNWLEQDFTHKLLLADLSQETIMAKIIHIAGQDGEAFPRRAAVSFLTMVFERDLWPSACEPTLQLMYSLINDSDWEVKVRVLAFWEYFIDKYTPKGLESSETDIPVYAANIGDLQSEEIVLDPKEKAELMTGFLGKLCKSKVSSVLVTSVEDCDPAVQEKAAQLVGNLRELCTKHGLDHPLKLSTKSKAKGQEENRFGKMDESVEIFLSWLHSADVDGLVAGANGNGHNTGESFEALLDDILVALGHSTEDITNDEDDNNAAAIDCY